MRRLTGFLAVLILSFCVSSGCTIGPRVKTEFVIVRPGRPLEVIQNVTVKGRRIEDSSVGRQDIGGWIAMPADHFEALMRAARDGVLAREMGMIVQPVPEDQ